LIILGPAAVLRSVQPQPAVLRSVQPHHRHDPARPSIRTRVLEPVHHLENEGDDLLTQAVEHLYDGVEQVPQLLPARRWGDVFQLLEDTTDTAERAAVVIPAIVDKNA
jgi:hypothetical protein